MTIDLSRSITVLFLLLALTGLSACTPSTPVVGKGPFTVLGEVGSAASAELVEARIILSRGKHSVEQTVPLRQNKFAATLQLPIGQWELSVLLLDADGKVQFQSPPQPVEISPRKPSIIELLLRPADSEVTVRIDLEGYIFRDLALRSRVHFNDEVYEIIRSDSQEAFETVLFLEPGSYEFKIELYTDSFRAGDRLGPGIWEIVTIPPNQSLEIMWSPIAVGLEISGRVISLLPAPENMTATASDEGLTVSWDPVSDPEIDGYFLFAQSSPLERFELLTPQALQEPFYSYVFDGEQPQEILFTAAAVAQGGLVGYYSAPYRWSAEVQD